MADQWFYARDANKLGPFSDAQLRELAAAGQIQPTDTVWKAGIEKGVVAAKVKNLFAAAPEPVAVTPVADAPGSPAKPAPAIVPDPPNRSELPPPPTMDTRTYKPTAAAHEQRKGRIIAAKGATVLGQDGINVQIVKVCTVCGAKDRNKTRLPIKQGTTRIGFFCPKCRKLRQVEIQGIL